MLRFWIMRNLEELKELALDVLAMLLTGTAVLSAAALLWILWRVGP